MAKKTYFFQAKNGVVIPSDERSARSLGSIHKLIGVSDGKAFRDGYVKAIEEQDEAIEELENSQRKLSTRTYNQRRKKIAEKAKQDLEAAVAAEQQVAVGHLEPLPMGGVVEGAKNPAQEQLIRQMLATRF